MKRRAESVKCNPEGLTDRMGGKVESGKLLVFCFLVLIMVVGSCTSRKKLVTPTSPAASYEWMTAKMNGELTLNADSPKLNFAGTVRMRRDSTIWISASAFLGLEGIRALITQDSVVLLNRMEQTYLAEPFDKVAARFQWPATFQETQAMMLGDQVELRFGNYIAKLRYSDIHWNEPTTFPIKINKNYERVKP